MSPAPAHRFDLIDEDAVLYCSECGAPYARAVDSCVTCGSTRLWTREEVKRYIDQSNEGMGLVSPVELVVAQNAHEAELIRDGLTAAGVRFAEQTDDETSVLIPGAGKPTRFFVGEADVERADEVLDDVEDQLDEADGDTEDGFFEDEDEDEEGDGGEKR